MNTHLSDFKLKLQSKKQQKKKKIVSDLSITFSGGLNIFYCNYLYFPSAL